jgi:hypothetical protein
MSTGKKEKRGGGRGDRERGEDINVGQKQSYTLLRGGFLFSSIQLM